MHLSPMGEAGGEMACLAPCHDEEVPGKVEAKNGHHWRQEQEEEGVVSRILRTMNETAAKAAVSGDPQQNGEFPAQSTEGGGKGPKRMVAELKRKLPDGRLAPASEDEIRRLDMNGAVKMAAREVQHMDKEEKRKWAEETRLRGNEQYREGRYEKACSTYMQCLAGLNPKRSSEAAALSGEEDGPQMDSTMYELQLPVLCNLAACMLAMKKYCRVVELCNVALSLDGSCFKALSRRGQAHFGLGNFDRARADLAHAVKMAPDASSAGAAALHLEGVRKEESRLYRDMEPRARARLAALLGAAPQRPSRREEEEKEEEEGRGEGVRLSSPSSCTGTTAGLYGDMPDRPRRRSTSTTAGAAGERNRTREQERAALREELLQLSVGGVLRLYLVLPWRLLVACAVAAKRVVLRPLRRRWNDKKKEKNMSKQ